MSPSFNKDSSAPPASPAEAPGLDRTRAALRTLLGLAIALPLAFFLGYAWTSYTAARDEVKDAVERLGGVAEEHALKVFEINDQLINRILDLAERMDDAAIAGAQTQYHAMLSRIGADIPQLSSINLFGSDGKLLVSNRFYPVPQIDIAGRADFQYHLERRGPLYVSPVYQGAALGLPVFNVSVARRGPNDEFRGLVSVSLRPDYFSEYYKQLAQGKPGVAIMLVHADGSIMARHPAVPRDVQVQSYGPVMQEIDAAKYTGVTEYVSPVDGRARFGAFRQIGSYPVYIVTGYARDAWLSEWYGRTAVVAGFTFVPSLALCVLLLIALRRLQREEEGWDQWRAEVTHRQAMEIAYKQARRLEALGQLTGSVAHDFNNLLMVVSTSTMLLRRRLAGREDVEQPLGALERSLEAGKRLTRQLLAFSRKQPLRPEVLDVPTQMGEFIELIRASLGGRISLSLDIDPETRPVYVDEGEFELAMLNLAINARDAMPEGGTLTVCARNVHLDGEGEPGLRGEFVAISFQDSGQGISEADLHHVFEPFFTTKAPGRGTGLGLAQVYGFCEQAGGTATVESVVGQGTKVTLYVPVSQRPLQTAAAPAQDEPEQRRAGRVLLVEDNPEVAQATRILLEQIGYAVEIAPSADEAMIRIDLRPAWDIVVSDVLMPGRASGIVLAKWLYTHHPELPVLLVTGYTAQLEQAKNEGLKVLAKPFDADGLRKAIDTVREAAQHRSVQNA